MPVARMSVELLQAAVNTWAAAGRDRAIVAKTLGLSVPGVEHRMREARTHGIKPTIPIQPYGKPNLALLTPEAATTEKPTFTIAPLPDGELDIDELLTHRKRQFTLKHDAHAARKLIPVKINVDGPIGIAHFGDPHVDDDGCDIIQLERDLKTVKNSPGMFAANLGDLHNNWIGRLAHLYAEQSTSAKQAWKLVEWMVKYVDWLYLVGGNHDCWSGTGDPVKWIMRTQSGVYEAWGVRVALNFPNGKEVRINARHDFAGHSMWNPNHGPVKAVKMGWRDHVLTCGHKHISYVAGPEKDPATGLLSWALRCAGYKVIDQYATEKGLPDQNSFPTAVTIIDPQFSDDDPRLITIITDLQEAADYLAHKRRRRGRK
jgi:hypothetical protein